MSKDGACEETGAAAAAPAPDADPGATIDAWRQRGDQRLDPVRFRFIEALATRAAVHHGDARRILDDKLLKLLAAYGEDLERARHADGDTGSRIATSPSGASAPCDPPAPRAASARQTAQPRRGPLAELVDHIARHASPHASGPAATGATDELKTLSYFRSTWSRLSVERRLTQSLAKLPENAGPLNSHYLVHQSLTLMRDLSPEYLDRFMSYVDTLLWVDQVDGVGALAGAVAPRVESSRKTARGKAG